MKNELVKVASIDELREQRGKLVVVDGEDIALFKRGDAVYALHNVCSHQHFSKLHEGAIEDLQVTCPMHGWTYDMITGKSIKGSGSVRTYTVVVDRGSVYIER